MNDTQYEKLKQAVLDYLSEIDNPVPDASMRMMMRKKLRKLVIDPKPGE